MRWIFVAEPRKEVSLNNNKPRRISVADPVIGTLVAIVVLVFLNMFLEYFGVWPFGDDTSNIIPFLNTSESRFFVTLVSMTLFLSIVSDIFKFVHKNWSVAMFVIYTVITSIIIFLLWRLHSHDDLWNPTFMQDLVSAGFFESTNSTMYQITEAFWNFLSEWIFLIILILFVIGIIGAAYMTFYRRTTKPVKKTKRAEII